MHGQGRTRGTRLTALAFALALLLVAPAAAGAAFPGANGVIAFSSNADGDEEIYTINPATGATNQLTQNSGPNSGDTDPAFSADGERIAFTSQRTSRFTIWTMGSSGEDPLPVSPGGDDFAEFDAAFAPDGRRIAFRRNYPILNGDIWTVGTDGSSPTELTNPPGAADLGPTYSPDGATIAFTRVESGQMIYTMGADGSNPAPLTPGSQVDYAPDGRSIVYSLPVGGDDELFLLALGGSPVQLTDTAADEANPAFSPDGRQIVYEHYTGGNPNLAIIDADGTNQRLLTETPSSERLPTWQPLNPPALTLTAEEVQKSSKTVTVTATSQNENASLTAGGTGSAPKPKLFVVTQSKKKTFDLDPVSLQLAPGVSATFDLTVPKKGSKLVKRALKAGKKAKVTVTATATDDFGATSSATAEVKIKKKKKKK